MIVPVTTGFRRTVRRSFGDVPGGLCRDVRGSLVPGLVRPVPVVVDQILLEHEGQVAFVEDQDPVQEFTSQGADSPLADGTFGLCGAETRILLLSWAFAGGSDCSPRE